MPLSLNPIQQISNNITTAVASTANQIAGNIGLPNTNAQKSALDNLVNQSAGAIGSALNGITGQINTGSIGNLSNSVQSFVESGVSAGVNALTTTVSSGLNLVRDQIENIASGIAPGLATGLIQGALQNLSSVGDIYVDINNDLIRTARARNLPSVDVLDLASPASVVAVYPSPAGDWRVKLQSLGGTITFPTIPSGINLSHKANYDNKTLVHANFTHPVYTNSNSEDLSVTCEWPVETDAEAQDWVRVTKLGRALTKMFFGSSANLGNPPPICTLMGMGATLSRIPVVVKEFKVDLKDDVHYINAGGAWVPRLSTITVSMQPVYSKSSQRGFNWHAYAGGGGNIPY